ncbi:Golgi-associated olfactory signaling regulator [Ascaphus truei]|uniref:Golgi-associated olfactory signaling regulator n=1 Tax=Ascaphus truei TaxID=8439 RepID=UPI003F59FC8E
MGSSTTVGSSGSLSATPNMPSLISDANNTTHGWNANSTDWLDSSENLGTSTFSSLPGWTTPENITNVNKDNLINDKIWKPTKLENTSAGDDIAHETRVGEKDHQKDFENKNNFGAANKLLALFLGMAGVLACLFILVYCIYSRQHKEDMFSHHRLYGEGFEDPVLHLDTPVDHYDFFSFRDTDMTPAQTPRHKCKNTVAYELKSDCSIEVPQGTSSNEYLRQVIQMGSLNSTSIGKNVT